MQVVLTYTRNSKCIWIRFQDYCFKRTSFKFYQYQTDVSYEVQTKKLIVLDRHRDIIYA